MVNGRSIFFGLYPTELAAAQAREVYIAMHPELMARSNFKQQERSNEPTHGRTDQ